MKTIIVIFSLLSSAVAWGQPSLSLRDFSGGLNASVSKFGLGQNQATECTNWNLSAKLGTLTKRNGYVAFTDSLPWDEELVGIYGYYSRDGLKGLFGVVPSATDSLFLGLGHLVYSGDYKYSLDTSGDAVSLFNYIYTGETPWWTTWKNDVFMANGRQRPIVIHEDSARDLIVLAPGEPRIVPINRTPSAGYGLDGEYRYCLMTKSYCGGSVGTNELADGGIETWSSDTTLTSWHELSADNYMLLIDSGVNQQGSYCAKITSLPGYDSDEIGLIDTVSVYSDSTYSISVRGKYGFTGYLAYLQIEATSIPGDVQLMKKHMSNCTDTNWQDMGGVVTMTDTTTALEIRLTVENSPEGMWDFYFDSAIVALTTPSTAYESYVSQPVKALDENVLLTNFTFHPMTCDCDTTDYWWDNIFIDLYRSKAYPGELTEADTFFLAASYDNLTATNLDTLRIIDSLPDDSLLSDYHIIDFAMRGRDSSGVATSRDGAPTFVANNVSGDRCMPLPDSGSETTAYLNPTYIAAVYAMTYRDTITGYESDTGRNCYIFVDHDTVGTDPDTNFVIGLPPIPEGMDHFIRVLYKALAFEADAPVSDTSAGKIIIGYQIKFLDQEVNHDTRVDYRDTHRRLYRWVPIYLQDTNLTQFYQLAIITDSADKYFTDVTPWSELSDSNRTVYYRGVAPINLTNLTAFNDRLWGSVGSWLYWSTLDTASYWQPFKFISLNADDGDEITAIVPFRDYIKVYKNKSQYAVYATGDKYEYERRWTVEGIGCIAPRSIAKYNNGIIYLSRDGVIYEQGIVYKDKGSSFGVISTPIKDFIDYPPDEQREAIGVVYKHKYWLSYPDKDTTYIYDFKAQAWETTTYSFSQVTMYDTVKTNWMSSSKDMLFIQDDGDKIFKADTTRSDNGTYFISSYRKPIYRDLRYASVPQFAIWKEADTTMTSGTDCGLKVAFLNNNGDTLGSKHDIGIDSTLLIYGIECKGAYEIDALIYTYSESEDNHFDTLIIEGLDIWMEDKSGIDIH